MTEHFVALLRGINVGGKNLIRMTDLAACFTAAGHGQVSTYIQSGNVLFAADQADQQTLTAQLQDALKSTFGVSVRILLLSGAQLDAVVAGAPPGFGGPEHRSDVIFLLPPLTVEQAWESLPTPAEGVDSVAHGPGVLYFSRVAAQAGRSRMSRIIGTPAYRDMTIRNWNTTVRLAALLADRRTD